MQATSRFSAVRVAAVCLALVAAFAGPLPAASQTSQLVQAPGGPGAAAPASAALETLAIVSGDKRHGFQVEVMRTPEQRARGLMHRRYMPADRGMLFDFARVEPVAMWMENTYIPLDMLFIRADGTIARIAENTEPLSQRTIPSGEPVLSVLEINGGVSRTLGIKPGDRIEHALFKR
ncbi:DUF192 domain-containing protein [Bosea sp. AAP35]|uniref:DUF192 domain-containing protein n=1 Tax=Bosea sp. AAP35 TaxID=1523417 RepID=UPI0006B9737F|nr:DUF192 domain-containing protein [Bosea sp. AAP35]